jgi:hypothetical protein
VATVGVVEHFVDTSRCVAACSRFLKPGGVIITMIPNMRGMLGWLQKRIDRQIFDGHVALDPTQLAAAHRDAGLIECEGFYYLVLNLGVLNSARASVALLLTRSGSSKSIASRSAPTQLPRR